MLTRNCPNCDSVIVYTQEANRNYSEKLKKICKSCASEKRWGIKSLEHTKIIDNQIFYVRSCPSCLTEILHKDRRRCIDYMRSGNLCASCSAKKRYSLNEGADCEFVNGERMFYRLCPRCNNKIYHKSRSHKNQQEKRQCECRNCWRETQGYIVPSFNIIACKIIDEYGKRCGYNFRHALNSGEFKVPNLKYFVDGYDVDKNVVIEVDESHHKYQEKKDKIREDEILNKLKCLLIRLNDDGSVKFIRKYIR